MAESRLSEYESLLYGKNVRRFMMMKLTCALDGYELNCTYEDAEKSNLRFYEDFSKSLQFNKRDFLDENDRQQIDIQNAQEALTSSLYLKSLTVIAANCEDMILNADVEEIPVEIYSENLQLRVDGKDVLSCTITENPENMEVTGSSIPLQNKAKQQNKRKVRCTRKTERDRLRIINFLIRKNDPDINLDPFPESKITMGTHANGTSIKNRTIVNTHANGTSKKTNRIHLPYSEPFSTCLKDHRDVTVVITDYKEPRVKVGTHCKTLLCKSRKTGRHRPPRHRMRLCSCLTPIPYSFASFEIGAMKYLIRRMKFSSVPRKKWKSTIYDCVTVVPDSRFI